MVLHVLPITCDMGRVCGLVLRRKGVRGRAFWAHFRFEGHSVSHTLTPHCPHPVHTWSHYQPPTPSPHLRYGRHLPSVLLAQPYRLPEPPQEAGGPAVTPAGMQAEMARRVQ